MSESHKPRVTDYISLSSSSSSSSSSRAVTCVVQAHTILDASSFTNWAGLQESLDNLIVVVQNTAGLLENLRRETRMSTSEHIACTQIAINSLDNIRPA
jgi:hypothetical protein